uniref:Phospholipase A2 n=1 Tax=Steinernema glaseri TaxID=37863 RepID=A0A1I7ZYS7_9BILA
MDCKSRLGQFDACCTWHDRCYDWQLGRNQCDDGFCYCLAQAARGSWACEKVDAPAFCRAVKMFGARAYRRAGK